MTIHACNPEPSGSPTPTSSGPPRIPSPDGPSDAKPGFTPTPSQKPFSDVQTTPDHGSLAQQTTGRPTVGKYTILEEVLAGGMGVVYKAHDTELGRTVALKMIKAGVLASSEETARFRREAQAAAQLDHPHIVPLYEIGQHQGCLYFTMAFAWGGSLSQQQARFAADARAAVTLLEKVARAVHHAHQRGILHRDLKPGNILLDEQGSPWVSDFGLAKFLDASLELTRVGQVMGTPAYMAPEQASGQTDQISPQTDVWALGVILYELLTGRRPFPGKTREEQLRQVQSTEPLRPRTACRSLARPLETVILKCLEKEPPRRYDSAEALADDLARWLRGEPVLARPQPWLMRTWRAGRRYRSLGRRLLLAALLLALLALAWRGLSPSVPPEERETPEQRAALEEKLARIRNGEKVTLLEESGPPAWSRWQPRWSEARAVLDINRAFRVQAQKQPALLELLPEAPKRYRLRARVQHAHGARIGRVGLFFSHGTRPTRDGLMHCFFMLAFNDRFALKKAWDEKNPDDNESQVRLTLAVYHEEKTIFSHQADASCALGQLFQAAGEVRPMPWRTLEAEVTPEWVRVFWEGKSIESFGSDGCDPRKALEEAARFVGTIPLSLKGRLLDRPAAVELGLGGGLGLYVEQGTAAFQSVVIEPLTPR
jgi:predicted Ser/Thr protein kinase